MIKRIDHVALAVTELDSARKFFIDGLGGKEVFSAPATGQGFHWTTIDLGSSCLIEIVNPIGEEGFLQRFLQKKGQGAHHITIQVDDIQKVQETLTERGIPTFGMAAPYPGWKELYIHPKDAFGILLQFAEFDPTAWIQPGYIPEAYRELMAARMQSDIIQLGDPRLRQKSEPVEDPAALADDIDRLKATLENFRAIHGFGRAIAAPQLGLALRFIAVDLGQGPFVMINPEITERSEETFTLWDDCLSFPSLMVKVRRHVKISVRYTDDKGHPQEMKDLDRETSELIQHEIDHLDGILAVDRAEDHEAIISRDYFNANPGQFREEEP